MDGVSRDLSQALACEPPHLSAYNVTIEERTPFHARYGQGLLKPLDEDVEIEMADRIPAYPGRGRPGTIRDLQLRPPGPRVSAQRQLLGGRRLPGCRGRRPELRQAMGEHPFTGLRMIGGGSVPGFSRRFGTKPRERLPRHRGLAVGGVAGRDRPAPALRASGAAAGQRALRSAYVNGCTDR